MELSFPLYLDVVDIEKVAFGLPLTKVANFTYYIHTCSQLATIHPHVYIYIYIYIYHALPNPHVSTHRHTYIAKSVYHHASVNSFTVRSLTFLITQFLKKKKKEKERNEESRRKKEKRKDCKNGKKKKERE